MGRGSKWSISVLLGFTEPLSRPALNQYLGPFCKGGVLVLYKNHQEHTLWVPITNLLIHPTLTFSNLTTGLAELTPKRDHTPGNHNQ